MTRACVLILTLASPALAEDWRVLSTDEIQTALSARVLQYADGATQNFFGDGRTLYEVSTGESWGKWWVEDERYCSIWPPSATPTCYEVEALGLEVRFISSGGVVTSGRYIDL